MIKQNWNLKSNMDRFIDFCTIQTVLVQKDLKSNMDRFIVSNMATLNLNEKI